MKATKQKIIQSAIELFNEKGLTNVRLQHIADKAGRSVGNLAYHFPNKRAIIQVIEEGDVLPNAPQHQGGLFMNYKLNTGKLSGFGINGGFNFVSERNSRAGVAEKLPAYTVVDAGLTYEVGDLIFRFTLNNVLDKVHWVGGNSSFRLFPGAPRSFLFGIGYSF